MFVILTNQIRDGCSLRWCFSICLHKCSTVKLEQTKKINRNALDSIHWFVYLGRVQYGHANVERFSPFCAFSSACACGWDNFARKSLFVNRFLITSALTGFFGGGHFSKCFRISRRINSFEQWGHGPSNVFKSASRSRQST